MVTEYLLQNNMQTPPPHPKSEHALKFVSNFSKKKKISENFLE